MSKSRSVRQAKRLPRGISRNFEEMLLLKIRDVLEDADDVQFPKGLGRKVLDAVIPIVANELQTAEALGKVRGKAEVEGAVPCAVCGHRLVWQACGTNAGWRHVEPMLKRHVATPREPIR